MAKTAKIKFDTTGLDELLKMVEGNINTFVIHDGVEYGIDQEFTERGHPSLVPAFERNTKDLPNLVKAAITQRASLNDALAIVAFKIQREWAGDVNVDTGAYRNSISVDREG